MCRREHEGEVVRFPKSYLTKFSGFYKHNQKEFEFSTTKVCNANQKENRFNTNEFFSNQNKFSIIILVRETNRIWCQDRVPRSSKIRDNNLFQKIEILTKSNEKLKYRDIEINKENKEYREM